jgi:2-polyprenyl-6-methoxyphenol hydroxylase-like FAD-dependent oxidoreductase
MNIAIAGCGIAGGALAILLARAGHAVTVFERAPQPGPVGAALLLQPSGQSVLRELRLLEEIAEREAFRH